MIIVSQNKDNIVNFNNVVSVGIEDFDLNNKNCFQRITAETLGTSVALGDYKTEERAKEVLEEIITCYTGDGELQNQEYVYYIMPVE